MSPNDTPIIPGPCCACEKAGPHRNIVMMHFTSPIEGVGWGCVICGLPADGAVAVLCDDCIEEGRQHQGDEIKSVVLGYPENGERIGVDEYQHRDFDHSPDLHRIYEEMINPNGGYHDTNV